MSSNQAPLIPMARSLISCATIGCLPASTSFMLRSLQHLDLLLDQLQPRDLALNLAALLREQLNALSVPPSSPISPADDDARAQVVQHQQ